MQAELQLQLKAFLAAEGLDPRDNFLAIEASPTGVQIATDAPSLAKKFLSFSGSKLEVLTLPHVALGAKTTAFCRTAFAPLRAAPSHAAEMLSATWLGARLLVLRQEGKWWLVKAPEGYYGWVHTEQIVFSQPCWNPTTSFNPNFLVTEAIPGFPNIPIGAQLQLLKDDDGLKTFALPSLAHFTAHTAQSGLHLTPTPASIIATCKLFEQVPYIWGSNFPGALDCSGLVQLVFRLHGLLLKRDASQQATLGQRIPRGPVENLQMGDLLFFGDQEGKIGHVAIYDSNGLYWHASGLVQLNSLLPAHPLFQPYRFQTWQWVCRHPLV